MSRRGHVLVSALLWTVTGFFLLIRGFSYVAAGSLILAGLTGLAAGSLKSFYILDRVAFKGLERILSFSDNTCIVAIYSWKTWLLLIVMIWLGILSRAVDIPITMRGIICIAIGWALVFSSRHGWLIWRGWEKRTKQS